MKLIRFFDCIIACIGLIILSPFFILVAMLVKANSSGPVFFVQERTGKGRVAFIMYKFRSMYVNQVNNSLITIDRDSRITPVGRWLRKYKIDEWPQLLNVLKGNMSLVGPRPEVKKYTDLYTPAQQMVLEAKPGITDYASLVYRNEQAILAKSPNPEQTYVQSIMPRKIRLNLIYLKKINLVSYFSILLLTVASRTRLTRRKLKRQ